ncbi:MAG: sensor histidine kinase [Candidatus Aminicenantes bacterium]|nr:sensor histidine kinase [Candidatus Aminicenantes bacterium]
MPDTGSNLLKWKIDIDTYRKLGRELITDRLTALYELIKNCYDANAREVYLSFDDVSSTNGKIIIKDDGIGMSLWDFRSKWMVISAGAKRLEKVSPPPFNRVFVGEKGIGRFSVDKLASRVAIKTKRQGMNEWLLVEIDWREYDNIGKNGTIDKEEIKETGIEIDKLEKVGILYPSENRNFFYWAEDIESKEILDARAASICSRADINRLAALWENTRKIYLTDIEHKVSFEPGKPGEHGTKLTLSPLRETWEKDDIERVYWELTKVLPPGSHLEYGFTIYVNSNEYPERYKNNMVENRSVDFATEFFEIEGCEVYQERLKFDDKSGKMEREKSKIENFGPVKFKLYYFDQSGKANFRKFYKNYRIDGIKIYRDGIITTPFAELTDDINKQRDILGIDKRRWSGFFEKISSHDLIGIVEITKEKNPKIEDATNRQDFIDCPEYRRLKDFIVDQIGQLEKLLKFKKEKEREKTGEDLKEAGEDLKEVKSSLKSLIKNVPDEFKPALKAVQKLVLIIGRKFNKGVKKQGDLQKELRDKEKLYQSIISLNEYSKMIAHALSISLDKIKSAAEFMKDKMPAYYKDMAEYMKDGIPPRYEKKKKLFVEYSRRIYEQMSKTVKILDFMLDFSRIHKEPKAFHLSLLINELIGVNEFNFKQEGIEIRKSLDPSISIEANESAFRIIIENLISNSRKALRNIKGARIIKISLYKEGEKNIIILFSDNGCGIPAENRDKIREVYFTTTADQGGAGLGLYIVENFLKSYKGEITLVDSEFKPGGASFKITLPVKKEEQDE